jgi:DNA-directed RNA polymerase subunit RPC12/RpoP
MVYGACPECDADVQFKTPPKEGQRVTCPECTSVLLVIGENPIELDWDKTESQEEYIFYES